MKKSVFLLLFLAGIAGYAGEVKLDNSFRSMTKGGVLKEWVLHSWSGFLPHAKVILKKDPSTSGNLLLLRDIRGKSGTVIRTKGFFPGKSGDVVRVTVRVRGKGKASLTLYQYTGGKSRKWNPPLPSKYFQLPAEWDSFVYTFRLTNGPSGETGFYQICLGCSKGGEMDVMSVTAQHEKDPYCGEVILPRYWTVFGPVDKNFMPSTAQLTSIPEKLAGQTGKKVLFAGNKLDFAPPLGGKGAMKCGWAFAQINSVCDQDCTLAVGADWWMQFFVNGAVVVDTLKSGNKKGDVKETPYRVKVRLKKGKNILGVKIITGRASSDFYIRNSAALRAMGGNIRLHKIHWIENFDSSRVTCSGKFTPVQGHPTPGLLTMTGQALLTPSSPEMLKTPGKVLHTVPADGEYAVTGVRIQNFGRDVRKDGSVSLVFERDSKRFSARVVHNAKEDLLTLQFLSGNQCVAVHKIPYRVLPADFLLGGDSRGSYVLQINSLADSSSRSFRGSDGFFSNWKSMKSFLCVSPEKKGVKMETVLDNFLTGTAVADTRELRVPFTIRRESSFDPVKAKWPLVFADEFNGDKVDESKWKFSSEKGKKFASVKNGILTITADWTPDKKRLQSVSLWSRKKYLYGYFEAKVRFRKESGWWSAFWLCTPSPHNPYMNGFEIDIYEDYYLSRKVKNGPYGKTLDHNLHVNAAGVFKSFNYNSRLPGSLEDYYVVGCKWTPFEISYYLNGKIMRSEARHSPYDSVTFDPFHHGNCLKPLHAILSGCCGRSGGDPKLGTFPDHFNVDYVRIYAYPQKDLPAVTVKTDCKEDFILDAGSTLHFNIRAKAAEGSSVKTVYLMDSGYLLDFKTAPPYKFALPLTREYFDTTQYVRPGRSGQRPSFEGQLHAWSIMVQDSKGRVTHTEPLIRFVAASSRKSTPYQGKARPVPGTVWMGQYDEGGQSVGYHDTTSANVFSKTYRKGEGVDVGSEKGALGGVAAGEWLNFTVDVQKSGSYKVKFYYGSPMEQYFPTYLISGKKVIGSFRTKKHKAAHWGIDTVTETTVSLKKGRQTLKLLFLNGTLNASKLEFIYSGK